MPNYEVVKKRKANPLVPFIGFMVMLVFGVGAYLAAPVVANWLATTSFGLGGTPILPLRFPSSWPPLVVRLLVAGVVFLVLLIVGFILMIPFTGEQTQEKRVSDYARERVREDAKQSKKRR